MDHYSKNSYEKTFTHITDCLTVVLLVLGGVVSDAITLVEQSAVLLSKDTFILLVVSTSF